MNIRPDSTRLSQQDLIRNARDGSGYQLHMRAQRAADRPTLRGNGMIEGWMVTERLQPGLSFHVMNGHALQDFSVEAQMNACVKISLILQGDTHIRFGNRRFTLAAKPFTSHLVHLAEPESCYLTSIEGVHREALNITLEPEWFERAGIQPKQVRLFAQEHLGSSSWRVPEYLWLQAKALVNQVDRGRAGQLAREGFALSLLSDWISHSAHTSPSSERPESRRAKQFLALMHSDEVLSWSLTEVGDHLGMSHATVQRYAKECLGMSLTQYLREQRLRRACIALKRDGISIFEAAMMAGYSHPGNFTAAFGRYRIGFEWNDLPIQTRFSVF